MIVFNTTFHVEEEIHEEFIEYMLQRFIPMSIQSGLLSSPRLSRIFGKEEEEGLSFAMEFLVSDLAALERWNSEESGAIYAPLLERFKEKMAGFSTVMQTIGR
ncbi:DUF4286 family protein [uncultured Proteiniphilum sp.]|uniref:DUF4286 family protein n=1 Tax=uncultured Proteiniphilum sp. TaxID=497637 RepID=UPI002630E8D8|nr:DUF4286 family protein [uncultured Proteiniphilum sp.]